MALPLQKTYKRITGRWIVIFCARKMRRAYGYSKRLFRILENKGQDGVKVRQDNGVYSQGVSIALLRHPTIQLPNFWMVTKYTASSFCWQSSISFPSVSHLELCLSSRIS